LREQGEKNILNRSFNPQKPNQIWVSDTTYIPTHYDWRFLRVIYYLYSRKVVGWSMSRKPDTLLVICALEMACLNRNPDRGLLFHSERWIQYIEIFYNRKRLHSYLGYRTPEEFVKNSLLN